MISILCRQLFGGEEAGFFQNANSGRELGSFASLLKADAILHGSGRRFW